MAAIVTDGTFNVVLTNPPFGTKLKISAKVGQSEGYQVSRKWIYNKDDKLWAPSGKFQAREIGIVFLERCINLLEEGGRLAIVLPDTYLFSRSYQWLVSWLCNNYTITHSINVPIEAFEPYCRAKTSILVLRKEKPPKDHEIVGVLAESFGENKHGHRLYRLDSEGRQTNVLEDEMAEAALLLVNRSSKESKLKFRFKQSSAARTGVMVASYHWRKPYEDALKRFALDNKCNVVSVQELVDSGELILQSGHGSPKSHFKGRGSIPYIKVSDIKNWRIIENPKYFIPVEEADRLRRKRVLEPFDLVTPTQDTWIIICTMIAMAALLVSVMTPLIASTNARIDELRDDVDSRFDRMDIRIDGLRSDMRENHAVTHMRLDALQDGLAEVAQRLSHVEGRLAMPLGGDAEATPQD